jgi:molecular chaperone DnaK
MAVERAKINLSNTTSVNITLPALIDELGMTLQIEVELTREQFETMITPLVERSIEICHQALHYSEYPPEMVDVVLLVGGSSQIPLVQRKVREAFGADKVVVHPRLMYAVAEGAAIVAAGLTDKVTTVSRDYFIKLVDEPRYKGLCCKNQW